MVAQRFQASFYLTKIKFPTLEISQVNGGSGYTSGVVPYNIFRGIYFFMLKVLQLYIRHNLYFLISLATDPF